MEVAPDALPTGTVPARRKHLLFSAQPVVRDLKKSAVHGVAATLTAQGTQFIIGIGSTAILARLLTPADFGLVAMTAAFTGFIALFSDGGLTMATVQRATITHDQVSALFWINVLVGITLAGVLFVAAPAIAAFYGEPRIADVTRVFALSFVLSGFAVQHRALMRRDFRFKALAAIDVVGLVAGTLAAIIMAYRGLGYWSLVAMSIAMPLVAVVSLWLIVPWRPSWPRRAAGTGAMLRFGGDVLSYNLVMFLKNQVDMMLLGWKWGPIAVGFYEKAGRMMLLPVRQVNVPLAAVLIPALSRIAADPPRLARFYLRSIELLLGVTIPMVFGLSLFAPEIVRLWLGEQWAASAELFRLLTVAAIMAVMISPMSWLLIALGQTRKYKWIGITMCSMHVLSFITGLPFGPQGVAVAYSLSYVVLFFPVWIWALHGTPMTLRAVLGALSPCLVACAPAGIAAYAVLHTGFGSWSHGTRTIAAAITYGAIYAGVLLGGFRRWAIYTEVLQELNAARRRKEAAA